LRTIVRPYAGTTLATAALFAYLAYVANGRRTRGGTVTKLRYVVTIEKETDGRFIASVPEVPGCHVYGRTRRQAVERAQRALQFYVTSLREQGRKPPKQPVVAVEVVVAA
jgi:predicted RNase H-like HicB family nuclease